MTCSQCDDPIGGHDPKCVIKGKWWCEKCVHIAEMADRLAELRASVDMDALSRRAAMAAGEDV